MGWWLTHISCTSDAAALEQLWHLKHILSRVLLISRYYFSLCYWDTMTYLFYYLLPFLYSSLRLHDFRQATSYITEQTTCLQAKSVLYHNKKKKESAASKLFLKMLIFANYGFPAKLRCIFDNQPEQEQLALDAVASGTQLDRPLLNIILDVIWHLQVVSILMFFSATVYQHFKQSEKNTRIPTN